MIRPGPDTSSEKLLEENRRLRRTIRDLVVERQRVEERLRQSDARGSAMLETALDCIITMDHEGKVVEFNPAAERTFGYRREDVVGRELAGFIIPAALREQHRQGMANYLATGEGPVIGRRIELPALRADGTEFPVELAITRIPRDGPPLFTAYLRDIGEQTRNERDRKQAEEALLRSEARLRGLMEQAPFSVQVFAPDGHTLRVNRAWEELWGVKFEQIGAYNVLEDRQLEARGILDYIRQGFAGQATKLRAGFGTRPDWKTSFWWR